MSNRNDLIPWIRYDSKGIMIPGTLVYRRKKPAGRFKRLIDPSNPVCCIPTTTTPPLINCLETSRFAEYYINTGPEPWENVGGESHTIDSECNTYFSYYDDGTYTYPEPYVSTNSILKRDGDGNLLWNKALLYPDTGYFASIYDYVYIKRDSVKNVIYGVGAQGSLIAMDLDGNILYSKMLNENIQPTEFQSFYFFSNALAISPDGNYLYITGGARRVNPDPELPNYDIGYILKIDATTGSIIKQVDLKETVSTNAYCFIYGAACDASGNVFATAVLGPYFLVKFDSNLNVIWESTFSSGGGYFEDPVVDLNGDVILAGGDGVTNSLILKVSGSTGNILWASQYVNSDPNFQGAGFWDRRIGSDNSIYLNGSTINIGDTFFSSLFAKIDGATGTVLSNAYKLNVTGTNYSATYWGYSGVCGPDVQNAPLLYALYGSPFLAMELKLGLGNYDGTYGSFVFTSVLPTSSMVPYTPVFGPTPSGTYTTETYMANYWDSVTVTTAASPRIFNLQTLP